MQLAVLILCVIGGLCRLGDSSSCHRSCSSHRSSVCGSDGHTYHNQCALDIAICKARQKHKVLELAHEGSCTVLDHPSANCNLMCVDEEEQLIEVCGSDWVTYASQCDFKNAVCTANRHHHHLTAVNDGPCFSLNSTCTQTNVHCPTSHATAHHICATNGYTYMNECYLKKAMCHDSGSPPLAYLHDGRCHNSSTNLSRTVDCANYADMSFVGVAIEGLRVVIQNCPHATSHSSTSVCSDHGGTFSSECALCTSMAYSHRISYSNLTVPIAYAGRCHYSPIIG